MVPRKLSLHQVSRHLPPIGRFISTRDEPDEYGVTCKLKEFDRLAIRGSNVGVQGEEPRKKYRALRRTGADALKVRHACLDSNSVILLQV